MVYLLILLALSHTPQKRTERVVEPVGETEERAVFASTKGVCDGAIVAPLVCVTDQINIVTVTCDYEYEGQPFAVVLQRDPDQKTRFVFTKLFKGTLAKFTLDTYVKHEQAYEQTGEYVQQLIRVVGFRMEYHVLTVTLTDNATKKEMVQIQTIWGAEYK